VRSEDQGNAALYDDVSHGKTHLAVQIDVENGQIEQPCLSQRGSAADIPGLGGDRMAKFFDHVGDHHPDHDLVFDEQHTDRCERHGGLESLAARSYAYLLPAGPLKSPYPAFGGSPMNLGGVIHSAVTSTPRSAICDQLQQL
jgi:hypothetical protein